MEVLAVGEAEQGIGAAHDASVDRGHHERRRPATQLVVPAHAQLIAVRAAVLVAIGEQRIGVAQQTAELAIGLGAVHQVEHGGDRAAAEAAADLLDRQRGRAQAAAARL